MNESSDYYDPDAALTMAGTINDIQHDAIKLINDFSTSKGKNDFMYRNTLINFLHCDIPVYATTYAYSWEYGGAEEGGWYYDHYSSPTPHKFLTYTAAEEEYERVNHKYHYRRNKHTDEDERIYNHQREYDAFLEIIPGCHTSKGRPYYS